MSGSIASVLRGTGSYVPDRVVPNVEFETTLDTSDEWIRTRTGIRERRYAAPEETCSSLAISAAKAALADARISADQIDLVICATVTADMMTPSTANFVAHGLGCRPIPSFDIVAACSGFLYAMSVADQFIRTGTAKNVLVVGADVLSRVINHADRNTVILFGDGAGSVVLSGETGGNRGMHNVRLFSDAGGGHLINVPSHATVTAGGKFTPDYLRMNGREVFKFAASRMNELVDQATQDAAKLGRTIKLLIPHQVNSRIIDFAVESCGFPAENVVVNLDRYGNTSAASIPIALDEAMRAGRAKPGDTILFVAFGGGLTWGSVMITL